MDEKETIPSDAKPETQPTKSSTRYSSLAVGGAIGIWFGCVVNRLYAVLPHPAGARQSQRNSHQPNRSDRHVADG